MFYTALQRQFKKFETNIPKKGIARPQSQFPHSCVCERFICSHDRSACSAAGKHADQSWEYLSRSQTLRHMYVETGRSEAAQFPEKEYINGIIVAVCVLQVSRLPVHVACRNRFEAIWRLLPRGRLFQKTTTR
jgi:hypothetical protein